MRDYIEEGIKLILKGLSTKYDFDTKDENFVDTPKRVSKAYDEIFQGLDNTEAQINEILSKSFPSEFSEMILSTNIKVYSMCPHHLLPVEYSINIAYIPEVDGKVLGISKLSRIASVYAKRPVLQEQLTEDISSCLMKLEGTIGSACVVKGKHFCMMMRGVRQSESVTITSSLKGIFREDSHKGSSARAEFLRLSE